MTVRILTTPLDAAIDWPRPRDPGVSSSLLPAVLPSTGAGQSLKKLTDPGVLVVTTGQQPGLFGGPLYTIHKALSAAGLAAVLEAKWGRPVQAIFWVAGDDHDFLEAAQAAWTAPDGSPRQTVLRERPHEAPLTPMYREPLGIEVEAALASLEADLAASEFREETLSWLRRHYRPDATVAGSFGSSLAELLGPLGVLCLDSTHPAVKSAAAPYLLKAAADAEDLNRALMERAEVLAAAGRDPGVHLADGATLVMLEGRAGRDRLLTQEKGFITRRGAERFTLADLNAIAARAPTRLSANVLLRPVVESAVLPTVAYIAGPGELRYLELTPPIYQRLGVKPQLPVPRWSGFLVEPRVDRVLEKFGASVEELLEPGAWLEARVVRSLIPDQALQTLAELRRAVDTAYDRLEPIAKAIDPTLEKPIQAARQHALSGGQEVEKRLVQHLKRRQEVELKQIERARAGLLPGGKPQERVLSVVPFLAKYGRGLLTVLAVSIRTWYASALESRPAPQ